MYPDGHSSEVEHTPDPAYGELGKIASKTTLKASATVAMVTTHTRSTDANGVTTDTYKRNGHPNSTVLYTPSDFKELSTSSAGSVVTTQFDASKDRPVHLG